MDNERLFAALNKQPGLDMFRREQGEINIKTA